MAFAQSGALTSMAGEEKRHRTPPYRIADPHSHSQAALKLYLNRQIFSWIDLTFGHSLHWKAADRRSDILLARRRE